MTADSFIAQVPPEWLLIAFIFFGFAIVACGVMLRSPLTFASGGLYGISVLSYLATDTPIEVVSYAMGIAIVVVLLSAIDYYS